MSSNTGLEEFYQSYTEEPHRSRRKAMLAKYGDEIKKLHGPDERNKYIVVFMVLSQIFIASMVGYYNLSWPIILVLAYVISGTITHSLTLAIHELSHNLMFQNPTYNTIFGIFTSLAHAVPVFVTFKKYHLIHHKEQGVHGIDPDLPTPIEGKFFRNKPLKLLYLFFQPLFYSLRPMILYPGDISMIEIVAYTVSILFDFAIFKLFGLKALAYMFLGTFLGSGLHPLAAHFIAEHYIWSDKKTKKGELFETYSYYGPLNWFTFNVGWHNEHHDFPHIPGSRLSKLHEIAPEFYEEVKETAHDSWVGCMVRFVMDPKINPYGRVIRFKSTKSE